MKHNLLLENILEFCINMAYDQTEIVLFCNTTSTGKSNYTILYKLDFCSKKLNRKSFELLFENSNNQSRKVIENIFETKEKYGIGIINFDIILQILNGTVTNV